MLLIFAFAKGQMKNEVLISVSVDNALHYVCAVNFFAASKGIGRLKIIKK